MRVFLLQIILIATPFVLYRVYVAFVMRRKMETDGKYNEVPLSILLLAGLVLAGASLIVLGVTQDKDTTVFEKARLEDGKVIPPKKD